MEMGNVEMGNGAGANPGGNQSHPLPAPSLPIPPVPLPLPGGDGDTAANDGDLFCADQVQLADQGYYHRMAEWWEAVRYGTSQEAMRLAAQAVETGACRIINIKPGRVGGFAE